MKAKFLVLTAILLCVITAARAHRVDEYLQATILSVEKDLIKADLYLTAGVAIAPLVIADIDADGSGTFSPAEQHAYVKRVLSDLILTLNGARLTPRLASATFPTAEEIRAGLGDIHVELQVELPRAGGECRLRWINNHHRRIASYQVNCLVSRDPGIRIGPQRRDPAQSSYELDFTQ